MLRSIVISACLAGLIAGLVLTIVQQSTVVPIILAAEAWESAAARTGAAAVASPAAPHQHAQGERSGDAAHAHAHDDDAWAPGNVLERTFWSALSNVSAAIGFALLLCAVYTLLPDISPARGMLWGLAGFVVFFANPGIGLHPEVPGTRSADLFDRQLWWGFTIVCSAAAVALIAWRRVAWVWALAAALLVLPHLVGAPQPAVHGGLAPQALSERFIWATTLVNALFWLTLGAISAWLFRRLAAPPVAA